jgi:hypothetical protein
MLGHQFFHAAEGATSNGLLGDDVESDFLLVEPGSIAGRLVHQKSRVCSQPAEHAGAPARGVVVHDEVNGEPGGDVGIDFPKEAYLPRQAFDS